MQWCNVLILKVTSTLFQKTLLNFTRRCNHSSSVGILRAVGLQLQLVVTRAPTCSSPRLRSRKPCASWQSFCIPSSHSSGHLGGMKELKWQMLAKRALWPGVWRHKRHFPKTSGSLHGLSTRGFQLQTLKPWMVYILLVQRRMLYSSWRPGLSDAESIIPRSTNQIYFLSACESFV